jgi:O-antigen ligase
MYLQTSRASSNTSQVRLAENQEQPYFSVDPSILQIASYGGAIGALFILLLIIQAITKFVKEVKKGD